MGIQGHLDLTGALERMLAGAEAGMTEATEYILGVARERAPHREGTLERGGRASVEVDEDGIRGAVSFGFPEDIEVRVSKAGHVTQVSAAKYAVRQHEELTWRHERGQAKYLESAMIDERQTAQEIIAQAIRAELEG